MIDALSRVLAVNGYLPLGYCISWSPSLLTAWVVRDPLIFLSYFSLPVAPGRGVELFFSLAQGEAT